MSFLSAFRSPNINNELNKFYSTKGAALLDVRTAQEFAQGHIPGSKNIPLQSIQTAADIISDKSTPLFVHCLHGPRSRQAVSALKYYGFSNVTNIGGIADYQGKVER